MHSFKSIGLLSDSKKVRMDGWASLARMSLEAQLGTSVPLGDSESLISALSDVLPLARVESVVEALEWLTDPTSLPAVPSVPAHPVDLFSTLLAHKLRYE